jgi:hypothetical protein
MNLGTGVRFFTSPNASLNTEVTYHVTRYVHMDGVGSSGAIEDPVRGDGLELVLSMTFYY